MAFRGETGICRARGPEKIYIDRPRAVSKLIFANLMGTKIEAAQCLGVDPAGPHERDPA